MRTVEKVRGGRVYIRPLDQRFTIGDRVTVDEELAAYLCEERGDFDRVDGEGDGCDVDHDALEGGEQCSECDFAAPLPEPDETEQDSMAALEAQLAAGADDESDASADSDDDAPDGTDNDSEDSDTLEGPHRDPDAVADGECGYFDSDEMDSPCSRSAGWGRDVDDGPCQAHADELEG